MAIRLELRTAGAIRHIWDGCRSHKSGPSLDTSAVVSVDTLVFCKRGDDETLSLTTKSANIRIAALVQGYNQYQPG